MACTGDLLGRQVETQPAAILAKLDRQRQADIAPSDDGDDRLGGFWHLVFR
jgi:hypothetical protein